MGGTDSVLSQQDARHLLRRTGFGAPPAQVSALQGRTRGDVVAELLDFKPTRFKPNGSTIQRAHDRWVKYMLSKSLPASRSGRQHALQEKLVLFWHNHFATSYDKVGDVGRMGQQNQLIRENCKGNWKTFLQAMNKNPAMMY